MRVAIAHLLALGLMSFAPGCASPSADPHSDGGTPPVHGKDKRIKDVADPTLPEHQEYVRNSPPISGALVIAVDTFDETRNGKSIGTIYVQDIGSQDAYSGISLFAPTFSPGSPRISPGDVLDLRGQYQETAKIGASVTFAPGTVLPQIAQPIATFRYETRLPEPRVIDVNDLTDFVRGRPWLGMLVRVTNVTLRGDGVVGTSGRLSIPLQDAFPNQGTRCEDPFPKPVSIVNDLFPVESKNLTSGQTVKSVTGVVSFFCSLRIAPRSAADIEL